MNMKNQRTLRLTKGEIEALKTLQLGDLLTFPWPEEHDTLEEKRDHVAPLDKLVDEYK
jgi:hypothetical protein